MSRTIVRTTTNIPNYLRTPMFAADIERGRVARANGCCLRQTRPEVQRITPPPIHICYWVDQTPPPRVSEHVPSPHGAKEWKGGTNIDVLHNLRVMPLLSLPNDRWGGWRLWSNDDGGEKGLMCDGRDERPPGDSSVYPGVFDLKSDSNSKSAGLQLDCSSVRQWDYSITFAAEIRF